MKNLECSSHINLKKYENMSVIKEDLPEEDFFQVSCNFNQASNSSL